MKLNCADVEAAVLGGAVLGGGGGGSMRDGKALGELAFQRGEVNLIPVDELPEDAVLFTCAYVGSPAAEQICVQPDAYLRAVELLSENAGVQPAGLITNECGGTATLNGWFQAAALGIPVVDAPCNGRAHPTGAMGSMGLHKIEGYVSPQAAAGGDAGAGRYVESYVSGTLGAAAALIRQAAVQAGGMVAVARNPVGAGYVRAHGAPGAIQQCLDLGRAMLAARENGGKAVCRAAADWLGGEIAAVDEVSAVELRSAGGFDVGYVQVGSLTLDFWNEYMTLEHSGERAATFPDLIMTLDAATGEPVTSAEVCVGHRLAVLRVARNRLLLGAGMFDSRLYLPAEEAIDKPIIGKGAARW